MAIELFRPPSHPEATRGRVCMTLVLLKPPDLLGPQSNQQSSNDYGSKPHLGSELQRAVNSVSTGSERFPSEVVRYPPKVHQ